MTHSPKGLIKLKDQIQFKYQIRSKSLIPYPVKNSENNPSWTFQSYPFLRIDPGRRADAETRTTKKDEKCSLNQAGKMLRERRDKLKSSAEFQFTFAFHNTYNHRQVMNLLKSILILSATSSGNLPSGKTVPAGKHLSRIPSLRTASLCAKCTSRIHEQSSSPQARRCQPAACDICSKEVSHDSLQWILDGNDKKSIISRSMSLIFLN